jgi:hypothetical protein
MLLSKLVADLLRALGHDDTISINLNGYFIHAYNAFNMLFLLVRGPL